MKSLANALTIYNLYREGGEQTKNEISKEKIFCLCTANES